MYIRSSTCFRRVCWWPCFRRAGRAVLLWHLCERTTRTRVHGLSVGFICLSVCLPACLFVLPPSRAAAFFTLLHVRLRCGLTFFFGKRVESLLLQYIGVNVLQCMQY
ncbi:unnamed protein product [Laminaria digitata]